MNIAHWLLITLCAAAGFPLLVGVSSFVCRQNGFRFLGAGYVARMSLVVVVMVWIIYLIPGGTK